MTKGGGIERREGAATSSSLVFRFVRQVSLFKHVSYAGRRLKNSTTAKILPEISPFLSDFGRNALPQWNEEMCQCNMILLRGKRMGLLPTVRKFRFFSSLDSYLIKMHAEKLASVLKSLVIFGERVVPLINDDPNARGWFFHEDLLIQSHHWRRLARSVLNLLKILGLSELQNLASARQDSCFLPSSDVWPSQDNLREAMLRAARMYGAYAEPDDDCPCLPPIWKPRHPADE